MPGGFARIRRLARATCRAVRNPSEEAAPAVGIGPMPFLIENIITAVLWLIGFALLLTITLVLLTIQRRLVRQLYFRQLDQARAEARREIIRLYGKPEVTANDLDAAL